MSNDVLEELRLLSVRELARATGLQVWRIYSLLREGKGPPYIKVGSTFRFPIRAVQLWLEAQVNNERKGAEE